MKYRNKRWCVAVVAATSLATTGALTGHAAPGGGDSGQIPGGAHNGDIIAVSPESGPVADAGVMLATEAFNPVDMSGDFDGDGTQDRATLSVQHHFGDPAKDATCWVDFALSGPSGNIRQGAPVKLSWGSSAYCPQAVVTDFDGDGAEGVTLYMDGDPSGWMFDADGTFFGEVNPGGIRPLDGLLDAGVDRDLTFADVSGDGKTDAIGQIYSNPVLIPGFDVMVTPQDGVPTWEPLPDMAGGYFATVADVDPNTPGAEIIYRGVPHVLEEGEGGDVVKLRCTVDMVSATTGDKRPLVAQDTQDVCPASSIEAGKHKDKLALAVGWVQYDEQGMNLWHEGDYHTIHQADASGVFHKVTDYPAPVARRDRVKLTTGSHMSGCVPVLGNDLNTLGARIRITGEPSRGVAQLGRIHGSQCIDYTWQHPGGGTDELEYVVEGPGGVSAPQRLIIESKGQMPPAPVAHDDAFTMEYGLGEARCLAVQDNDDNAAFSTINVTSQPEIGDVSVRVSADGSSCVFYDRLNHGSEPASFTYTLSHMGRTSEPATVEVTMAADVVKPKAHDDTISWEYAESQPQAYDLLANDTNVDGGKIRITTPPEHGMVRPSAGSSFEYYPHSTSVQEDSFQYEVSTSGGVSQATATIVRVGDMPAVPVAVDDRIELGAQLYRWAEEPQTFLRVVDNDEVTALGSLEIVKQPSLGSARVSGNILEYTLPKGPAAQERRETTLTYTVTNVAGVSQEATVTVVLLPKTPAAPQPVAADDRVVLTYGGNEMGCIPVLLNDTNVRSGKGQAPEWTEIHLVDKPGVGFASVEHSCINYVRAPGAVGDDEFTYKVITSSGESQVARVRVVMHGTAPAPGAALFF